MADDDSYRPPDSADTSTSSAATMLNKGKKRKRTVEAATRTAAGPAPAAAAAGPSKQSAEANDQGQVFQLGPGASLTLPPGPDKDAHLLRVVKNSFRASTSSAAKNAEIRALNAAWLQSENDRLKTENLALVQEVRVYRAMRERVEAAIQL